MTRSIASRTDGNIERWPVWNSSGSSSSMRNWLKVKPVGPISGTRVDSRYVPGAISSTFVSTLLSFRGCLLLLMAEEHVDGGVGETRPPVAAGIVGELLIDEPGADRRPEVDHAGIVDPDLLEPFARAVEGADRRCVRFGGRLEAGDRPLEQQLVASRIGHAELDEPHEAGAEQVARFGL